MPICVSILFEYTELCENQFLTSADRVFVRIDFIDEINLMSPYVKKKKVK